MRVGFTGTRRGMTPEQWMAVHSLLQQWKVTSAIHGACHGADREFDQLVRHLHPLVFMHLRPSNPSQAEWARRQQYGPLDPHRVSVYPEAPPLVRNRAIVSVSDRMIATPGTATEVMRSGTWATIRWARRVGRCLWLVWPDGLVQEEGEAWNPNLS
jgi:hypothetical protein